MIHDNSSSKSPQYFCEGKAKSNSRKERRDRQKVLKNEAKKARKVGNHQAEEEILKAIDQENDLANNYYQIMDMLRNIFSDDEVHELARDTGFQVRTRKVDPSPLVATLIIGSINPNVDSLEILCSYLRTWFAIVIEPQSLSAIINRKQTVDFVTSFMEKIITYKIDRVHQKIFSKLKVPDLFSRVIIQDSTVISLPDNMWRLFPGCGGSASRAAIKIDITMDLIHSRVIGVKFVSGNKPDASLSKGIIDILECNDLIIRDLGYFNLSCFREIAADNYFISRLTQSVNVYLKEDDEEPVDIIEHLKKIDIKNGIDLEVYIGKKERLPVRLLGIKVPPEVAEARGKRRSGSGKEQSESTREWNGFTFMITNVSKDKLSLNSILNLYKIRWQIELFFKNMKSNFEIDEIRGENRYRMLTFIYIKITLMLITVLLYALAQALANDDQEVSLYKFTIWLQKVGGIKNAILTGDFSGLLDLLILNLKLLCKKRNRKRTTTWKTIEEALGRELGGKNVA